MSLRGKEMKKPVVQFKNLYKTIGKKEIIKDLSFDVYPGEVFGFLGPNGAGKTTTIRMMLGLMKMTKGDVIIDGISVRDDFENAIKNVGGIVENPELYKYMTGLNNLRLFARMHEGVTEERIMGLVKQVGLERRIKDKVKTYSLGMRQRVGLAQALLHNPKVIVLDEPTNGLDPAGIKELRNYLRDLAIKHDVAVIVSSHMLTEMELMCDRFGIIQQGELVGIHEVGHAVDDRVIDKLVINAMPIDKAIEVLENMVDAETKEPLKISQNGNFIDLFIDYRQIPEIIKKMVESDISIYEIRKQKKNLEDRFMEMTGGNEIA